MPVSTGTRNATTIHDAWPTVRAKRAWNSRRGAIGVAISSFRSSDEEERRERGDDAAEGEEGEKRQEEPGQAEPQEVVAELGVLRELPGEPERSPEDRREHEQAHRAEEHARA